MRVVRALALVVLLGALLALPAFGGGGAGRPAATRSSPTGFVSDAIPAPNDAVVATLPSSEPVQVLLALRPSNASELSQWDASVSDPSNPDYRQFLNEAAFERSFAPAPSAVLEVERVLRSAGAAPLAVTADRLGVSALAPASVVDRLFHVSLVSYRARDGAWLYSAEGTPALPPSLAGLVLGLSGLSDATPSPSAFGIDHLPLRPAAGLGRFVQDSQSGADWYLGSDYTQALEDTALFPSSGRVANASYANGTAVASLLVSGYNGSVGENLPPWDPGVLYQYFNDTFPAAWPIPKLYGVPVPVDNVTPPLPGYYNGLNDSSDYEIENSLDLEMIGSLAPGSSDYNFYFPASTLESMGSGGTASDPSVYFSEELAAALDFNYTHERLVAVTNSYGLGDLDNALWDTELAHAAAIGVTVLAASGDQGDAPESDTGRSGGQWPGWPATSAFNTSGTVSVGGVSLALNGSPTTVANPGSALTVTYDPTVTGITTMDAWWDDEGPAGTWAGSEGGASSVYPEPSWQLRSAAQPAIVNATELQGQNQLGRAGPDLAFPANDTLVYVARDASGTYYTVVEGTSIASPLFAGILAEVSAVEGRSFGFLDPELYRLGSYFSAHPGGADPFEPVLNGSNYVFSAGPGWNAVTGWGELSVPRFLAADENATLTGYNYSGPAPGLPPPSSPRSVPVSTGPFPVILLVGLLLAIAIVLLIFLGRPRAPPVPWPYAPPGASASAAPPPPAGAGATGPPPPHEPYYQTPPPRPPASYPPASFVCPFCGALRAAEAGRCPGCGAF